MTKRIVKWKNDANEIQLTGSVFYYDPADGDDDNTGYSTTQAWKTIGHASGTIDNGDVVLPITIGAGQYPRGGFSDYYLYKLNNIINNSLTYDFTSRDDVLALVTGSTYYIDADNGDDDTGDGSNGNPWQTIGKAQSSVTNNGGDCVVLKGNSNYGVMTDTEYSQSAANWTVWINEEGSAPIINNISMVSQDDYNLRLIFYGIKIAPAWVDPGSGPDYNQTATCVYIWGQNYIEFYNCEIVGTNKYLTPNITYLREADYIKFERCHGHVAGEGMVYLTCNYITYAYNYVHNVCASGIKDGYAGSSYITIEGNHIHDCIFNTEDQYGEGADFHGSVIAMNNATMTIRNNILHDGGGTNVINFYGDGSPVYTDILIENNIVYNPSNTTAVCVDYTDENVVIRNNLFIGQKKDELGGSDMYHNAILICGFNDDGSGLSIYNNIFVGNAAPYLVSSANCYIDYNIVYYGSNFDTTNAIVALTDEDSNYFESGFFNGSLDLEYGAQEDIILDLTYNSGCGAIGFGDSANQPSDSLGSLDANDEFIIPDGKYRDSGSHDAGPYQT